MRIVENGSFGVVTHPGEVSARPAPAQEREPNDPIASALTTVLFATKDETEQQKIGDLISRRAEMNKKCIEVIEAHAKRAHAELAAHHEDIKAQCRAAQAAIDQHKQKVNEVTREWNAAADKSSKARLAIVDAVEARKSLSRFSPSSSFARADEKIAEAQKRFEAAQKAEAQLLQTRNQMILVETEPLNKKLKALSDEETRLYAALHRVGYTDPQFGIQVPPGASL